MSTSRLAGWISILFLAAYAWRRVDLLLWLAIAAAAAHILLSRGLAP